MPTHQREVFYGTILADDGAEYDRSRNASLPRERGINRVDLANQKALGDALGNPHPLRSSDFRHGHGSGADNAADHTAHLAAGNTTRNPAHDAAGGHLRRSFVFLNHLDLLRDLGRCAQSSVHDVGLNLMHNFYRCGSRGGRRWRWRRGHQKGHKLLLGQRFGKDEGHQNHDADQSYLENDREGRGASPLRLQPATGFQKAIFKHSRFSPLRAYVNLDTDRFPFAPKIDDLPKPAIWAVPGTSNPYEPYFTFLRIKAYHKMSSKAIGQLLGPDGHGRGTPALTDPPILISHQNRSRNGDRRIGSDQDADDQRETEATKHLAAEQIECEYGKEG